MSDILEHETFTRVFQKTKAAMEDGLLAVAAISSPTKLTKGKEYRIKLDVRDDTLYFVDDSDVPVYLIYPEDLKQFEPLVDVSDMLDRVKDVDGRLQERVKELVRKLGTINSTPSTLQPGDVVVYEGAEEDKPYVVASTRVRRTTGIPLVSASALSTSSTSREISSGICCIILAPPPDIAMLTALP